MIMLWYCMKKDYQHHCFRFLLVVDVRHSSEMPGFCMTEIPECSLHRLHHRSDPNWDPVKTQQNQHHCFQFLLVVDVHHSSEKLAFYLTEILECSFHRLHHRTYPNWNPAKTRHNPCQLQLKRSRGWQHPYFM